MPAGHNDRGNAIAHRRSPNTLAVRIRLTRVGATKQPSYRFVVADSRAARDGRNIDTLGHYNPRSEPVEINVDAEKATKWMSQGAKPSATVERLFRQVGILPDAK
jgi:small subunit ribosomal protein S16